VMKKRGAVNWTIGKLLNIVLLVVVLVLVVYGMMSGGLNPLIDNIGAQFDEVQIMLGFEEDFYSGCYSLKILDLNEGPEFLKSLGVSGNDAFFEICRDGACTVNGSEVGSYRLIEGNVDKFENGGWVRYFYYDRIFSGRDYWEKYNVGVDLLESLDLKKNYSEALTRKFVLFGDGNGKGENVTAVWQNDVWVVQENGKEAEYFDDDGKAIEKFLSYVDSVYDDKVFWGYDSMKGMDKVFVAQGGIGDFVKPGGSDCSVYCGEGKFNPRPRGADSSSECSYGTLKNNGACCCTGRDYGFDVVEGIKGLEVIDSLVGGDNGELDIVDEFLELRNRFEEIRMSLLEEAEMPSVKADEMRNILAGKTVMIGKKEFVISVENAPIFPVVVFDSGDDKFGLELGAFSKVESELFGDVALRYFPVYLVEWNGRDWKRVGDEEVYRLSKDKFDEVVFGDLVSKFLRSKCK